MSFLFARTYEGRAGERIEFTVDTSYRTFVRHAGKGTMEGTRAALTMFDDALRVVGTEHKTKGLVDIRELYDAPIRGQMALGRWLLKNRRLVERIAVFGGRPIEMKIARAVAKLAGLSHVSGFFNVEDDARRYLDW